jgi:hypothetical protein
MLLRIRKKRTRRTRSVRFMMNGEMQAKSWSGNLMKEVTWMNLRKIK